MTPATNPVSHTLAVKAVEFITECLAHSLTQRDMEIILEETIVLISEHGPDPTQAFVQRIRAQQVINKLHTTCTRLRRGHSTNHEV